MRRLMGTLATLAGLVGVAAPATAQVFRSRNAPPKDQPFIMIEGRKIVATASATIFTSQPKYGKREPFHLMVTLSAEDRKALPDGLDADSAWATFASQRWGGAVTAPSKDYKGMTQMRRDLQGTPPWLARADTVEVMIRVRSASAGPQRLFTSKVRVYRAG